MQLRRVFAIAAILPCVFAAALAADTRAPRDIDLHGLGWLPSDVFETGEGLPDPTVNAIAVLPDGQVWLGTMRGLGRMNGARITADAGPAGSAGKAVLSLAATPDGDLLAAIDGSGVQRLHDGAWQALGAPFGNSRVQRLRVFGDGRNARIFATGSGVAEWRDRRWHPLALPAAAAGHEVFDVALQPATTNTPETLWVATFGAGLQRCSDDAGCAAMPIDGTGPRTDEVRSLQLQSLPDGSHALWLGLQGGGVARLAQGAWTRWHTGNSGLPSDFVTDLAFVDVPGAAPELWAGGRSGLAILREGRDWSVADPRVPQLRERVRAIAQTRTSQGMPVVWVGSDSGAVRTPLAGPWRTVSTLGSRGNGVWAVRVERTPAGGEQLWLASDGDGLARYHDGRWQHFGRAEGLPSATVRSVVRVPDGSGEGTLWVGTWGGHVARLQGGRFVEVATPWPKLDDEVTTLLAAGDVLWASTRRHGLARWDGRQWDWMPPGKLMPSRAFAMLRQGRDLWFSTADRGLARYRDGAWRFFAADIGLPLDALYDMRLIAGGGRPLLWIGSMKSGLLRIDIGDPDHPRVVRSPALPALPLPMVYGAVRDGLGDLLVCTDYGVFGWRPLAQGYASTAYHRQDGLPHDECNANALQVDDRGRVWIGTVGGAAVYTPPSRAARTPSPLLLTGLLVDGKPVRLRNGKLRLPRTDSSLEVHADLLTGEKEAASRYRVRLLGDEGPANGWQHVDTHAFSHLPAGLQRVRIEALDFAGVAAAPLEFEVEVPEAWWRTPLARALQVLAALLLFGAVLKLRERQLRHRAWQLHAMVRERTAQLQARETDLQRANDELRRLSYTDPLTGLGNRRRLFEALDLQCRGAANAQRPLALLLLDLDHFKAFNDTHGHIAGDLCLQDVARRLLAVLPPEALAARYGGEEFCVLLPGLDEDAATGVAERLRGVVAGLNEARQDDIGQVTASIGVVSVMPRGDGCADTMLAMADRALYRAKAAGRNRVERASQNPPA